MLDILGLFWYHFLIKQRFCVSANNLNRLAFENGANIFKGFFYIYRFLKSIY